MAAIRDFFGTNCPHCAKDILQQAPSTNRMPGAELAFCPSCRTQFSLADLQRGAKPSLLGRLFGNRPSRT